jgi:hypothetical protein
MKLDLNIRDLKTGERQQKAFDSEQQALEFLRNRPKYTDVLGVASHHVPPELNKKLREAMRPLDAEEQVLERQLEAAIEQAEQQRAEQQRQRAAQEAAEHRKAMATADPNRPMTIHYRFNRELSLTDAADPRTITDEAREAVTAWVNERNGWVESRGQVVGEANVTVYPGPLPDGVTERVQMGSFVPVTAPKKQDPS